MEAVTCSWCGEPAEGYAKIGGLRYCHGDYVESTCYMKAQYEFSEVRREMHRRSVGIGYTDETTERLAWARSLGIDLA